MFKLQIKRIFWKMSIPYVHGCSNPVGKITKRTVWRSAFML